MSERETTPKATPVLRPEIELSCDAADCAKPARLWLRVFHLKTRTTCFAKLGCTQHVEQQMAVYERARALNAYGVAACSRHHLLADIEVGAI